MNQYCKLEWELATALGMEVLEYQPARDGGFKEDRIFSDYTLLPMWARNDASAFRLMVEYNVHIKHYANNVFAYGVGTGVGVDVSEHPDRYTAVRVAIVKAITESLS